MASPRALGAGKALLIAIPFAFLLAWGAPTSAPTRAELAAALSRGGHGVTASDISDLKCRAQSGGGAQECRWQQREDNVWQDRKGRLGVDEKGWVVAGPAS